MTVITGLPGLPVGMTEGLYAGGSTSLCEIIGAGGQGHCTRKMLGVIKGGRLTILPSQMEYIGKVTGVAVCLTFISIPGRRVGHYETDDGGVNSVNFPPDNGAS